MVAPQIALEVWPKHSLITYLIIYFLCSMMTVAYIISRPFWYTVTTTVPGDPCPNNAAPDILSWYYFGPSCSTVQNVTDPVTGLAELQAKWYGFFSKIPTILSTSLVLRLYITRDSTSSLEAVTYPVNLTFVIKNQRYCGHEWAEMEIGNVSTQVVCKKGQAACNAAMVLEPQNFGCYSNCFYLPGNNALGFDITYLNGFNPYAIGSKVQYTVTTYNMVYVVLNTLIRVLISAWAVVFGCWWTYGVAHANDGKRLSWGVWMVERQWLMFLVFCIYLVGATPFFFWSVLDFNNIYGDAVSEFFIYGGFGYLMVICLMLVDGLRNDKRDLTNHWTFYVWKLLWLAVYELALLAYMILRVVSAVKHESLLQFPGTVAGGALVVNIIWILSLIIYVFWLYYDIVRTRRVLTQRPFLQNRYRQLSFWYVLLLLFNVCLVLLVDLILRAVYNAYLDDRYFVEPALALAFISCTSATMAAGAYSPPSLQDLRQHQEKTNMRQATATDIEEGKPFSLPTAAWMFQLALHAYCSPPDTPLELEGTPGCWRVLRPEKYGYTDVHYVGDEQYDVHCFILRQKHRLVITFRGSASLQNYIQDLKAALDDWCPEIGMPGHTCALCRAYDEMGPIPHPGEARRSIFDGGLEQLQTDLRHEVDRMTQNVGIAVNTVLGKAPKVHHGFAACYQRVRIKIFEVLRAIQPVPTHGVSADVRPFSPHIFVTGHSLGGALATLACFEAVNRGYTATMYNFGSPRVGNSDFVDIYNELVPASFRIVNDGDLVTGIPKWRVMIGTYRYKHVGQAIVMDPAGNMIIDPMFVERIFKLQMAWHASAHETASYNEAINACIRLYRYQAEAGYMGKNYTIARGLNISCHVAMVAKDINLDLLPDEGKDNPGPHQDHMEELAHAMDHPDNIAANIVMAPLRLINSTVGKSVMTIGDGLSAVGQQIEHLGAQVGEGMRRGMQRGPRHSGELRHMDSRYAARHSDGRILEMGGRPGMSQESMADAAKEMEPTGLHANLDRERSGSRRAARSLSLGGVLSTSEGQSRQGLLATALGRSGSVNSGEGLQPNNSNPHVSITLQAPSAHSLVDTEKEHANDERKVARSESTKDRKKSL